MQSHPILIKQLAICYIHLDFIICKVFHISKFKLAIQNEIKMADLYGPMGRRGIAPTRNCTYIFKNVINLIVCIKLIFFLQFPFYFWFIPLVDIIGRKLAPGDNKFNFKKVGAIPCGCATAWTGPMACSDGLTVIYKYKYIYIKVFFNPFVSLITVK